MPATTTEPKFNCSTCGKEYRWKPELAGKKAKCKCGNVIAVPAAAPAAPKAAPKAAKPAAKPAEQDVDFDGLYALAQEEKKATTQPAPMNEGSTGYRCPSCSAGIPPGTVVCPNCRLDMRTGARQAAPARAGGGGGGAGVGVLAAAGAYASATPSARSAVLGYGGGGRAPAAGGRASDDILYEGGKFRSLYLPIGLIVLGILFYFGQLAFSNDKLSAGIMVGLVFARVVMDSILIFIAMLIAVKGFDMGFGAFGPGILKILAIAMGPGALGQMIEDMMGGGMGPMIIGAVVTIVLYYTLIKVLFNLDLGETFLLVFLIYGVRRVLGTFLFVAIIGMASSGLLSEEGAGAIGGGAIAVVTAGEDDEEVEPKRMLEPETIAYDLDELSQKMLSGLDGGADTARDFIERHENRAIVAMTHDESLAFIENLEKLGAKDIKVLDYSEIKLTKDSLRLPYISLILLELPTDPAARKQIFDIRAALEKKLGLEPEMVLVEVGGRDPENNKQEALKDWGQKYLDIRLDGPARWNAERNAAGAGSGGAEDGDGEEMEEGESDGEAPAEGAKPDGASPEAATPDAADPAEKPAPGDASGDAPADAPAAETPAPEAPAEPAPADAPF